MIKTHLIYAIKILFLFALTMLNSACVDDFQKLFHISGEEGLPTSFRLCVSVDEPEIQTRADLTEIKEREIKSLWIGLFKKKTENGVTSFQFAESRIYGDQDVKGLHQNGFVDFEEFASGSGTYIITAVANPNDNSGICEKAFGSSPKTLIEILEKFISPLNTEAIGEKDLSTLEDFKSIAVVRGIDGSVLTPSSSLAMHGVFVPNGNSHSLPQDTHLSSNDASSLLMSETVIEANEDGTPASNVLNGVLHFRRIMSQVKFKISCDDTFIDPATFQVTEAKVFNVPTSSWLAERGDADANINSGDAISYPTSGEHYCDATSVFYTSEMDIVDGKTIFDWWQMENRRTGLSSCSSYADRERERKNPDGSNSGHYTSLPDGYGQKATYVTFKAKMRMKNNKSEYTLGDKTADISFDADAKTEIEAVYTIHLGYMDNDCSDFNCRRNFKYTYNVTVKDANAIVVEAFCEDAELQPGQEGIATFISDDFFELDAHYSVFNIALSNRERVGLSPDGSTPEGMKWLIRVYGNDKTPISITESNCSSYDEKYWKWIEFRPTSGPEDIAVYYPTDYSDASKRSFTLDNIGNLSDFPGSSGNISNTDASIQYYTVFVNEYVYEDDGGTNTSNWKNYVNLPDRQFWLKVIEHTSPDKESTVVNAKYALRQKSIQTFYADTYCDDKKCVFGSEHLNETLFPGKYVALNDDGSESAIEGRHFLFCNSGCGDKDNSSLWNKNKAAFVSIANQNHWNYYLNYSNNTWNVFDNVISGKLQGEGKYVVLQRTIDSSMVNYTLHRSCMNRNRDLNGNGVIDDNEIRWLLPDNETYIKMAVGADGLQTKFVNFKNVKRSNSLLDHTSTHYGSIDGSMFWAEEGYSTEYMSSNGANNRGYWPEQVRCVRILGRDVTKLADSNEKFELAFIHNEADHTVEFKFNQSAYREKTLNALPPHKLGEDYNRPYKKIEYDVDFATNNQAANRVRTNWIDILTDDQVNDIKIKYGQTWNWNNFTYAQKWYWSLMAYNPCAHKNGGYEKGWRIPNETEFAAMTLLDIVYYEDYYYFVSCTQPVSKTDWQFLGGQGRGWICSLDGPQVNSYAHFFCVRDVE